MQSYIIIGGGIAGLTAANALAQPGRKVTLLEQSEQLGGRAITQQQSGFSLNLGPHALYSGGPAMRAFTEWKIPFEGHPPPGGGYLAYQGKKYPSIAGASSSPEPTVPVRSWILRGPCASVAPNSPRRRHNRST